MKRRREFEVGELVRVSEARSLASGARSMKSTKAVRESN